MRRLKRFITATSQERTLLVRALCWVVAIRIALFVLSFRHLKELAGKLQKTSPTASPVEMCVWAVRATSRLVPAATCLTQALAGQILLARCGYNSRLEIGVTKNDESGFQAHAWLIYGEKIVIGASGSEAYMPIASWNTPLRGITK